MVKVKNGDKAGKDLSFKIELKENCTEGSSGDSNGEG